MMKITLSIFNLETIDIGVNPKQTIVDTLTILQEKGICIIPDCTYVRVPRLQSHVSVLSTYEQSGIIEGDILSI